MRAETWTPWAPPMAPEPAKPRRMPDILKDVATRHRIRITDITSQSRSDVNVAARQEFYALAMDAGRSSNQVAAFIGRDHSTVLHGAKKHRAREAGKIAS